jgi:hypothetical protein
LPRAATEHADLKGFYGSDGTRTRDLRRDRPVMALPGCAGIGGDYGREQGFPTRPLRESAGAAGSIGRAPAGSARDEPLSHRKLRSRLGANGCNPRRRVACSSAVLALLRLGLICGRLRPLCSMNAPSSRSPGATCRSRRQARRHRAAVGAASINAGISRLRATDLIRPPRRDWDVTLRQ